MTYGPAPQTLSYRPKLNARHSPPDPRRWRYQIIPATTPDPSKPRSLAQYFEQPPDDQGSEGSCTANSGCLCAEACGAIGGAPMPVARLSREQLYYLERVADGDFPQDAGSSPDQSFNADIKNGGLVLESVWGYDANPAEQPPPAVATAAKHLYVQAFQPVSMQSWQAARDAILTALDNRQPLVIGFDFFNGWFNDYGQLGLFTAAHMDYVAGGHQITIKGWVAPSAALPNGGILCQNSWGQTSPARTDLHPDAKAGDVIMPIELIVRAGSEVLAAVPAQAPAPAPTPAPSPTCKSQADAVCAQVGASLTSVMSTDTRPATTPIPLGHVYSYAQSWLTYEQQMLDATFAAEIPAHLPAVPGVPE